MKILFLSTWFPYPPNQGSKIRAYHLLRALSRQHEIALLSFEDAPIETQWMAHLQQLCSRIDIVHRQPFAQNKLKALYGIFSPKPRAIVASRSREMAARVHDVAADWNPDLVVALTFMTAPYALELQGPKLVLDVDTLLSHMLYEEFQQSDSFLTRARRYVAYQKLRAYESELYRGFDLCLVTSERDTHRIADYVPLSQEQIGLVPNGVDVGYYQAHSHKPLENSLVFNGALTYHPNYDAMGYFLKDIFPSIRAQVPGVRLTITGSTKGVDLQALNVDGNVVFSGYVEDIRQVVARSSICVVPLRKGAGTRLKILEAMALGVPVISTTKGAEGLNVVAGNHLLIADKPAVFASQTVRLLQDRGLRGELASNAIQLVSEAYDWDLIGENFCQLIGEVKETRVNSERLAP